MSNVLNLVSEDTFTEQTDGIVSAINGFGSGLLEQANKLSFVGAKLPRTFNLTNNKITTAMDFIKDTTGIIEGFFRFPNVSGSRNYLTGFGSGSSAEKIVFLELGDDVVFGNFNEMSDPLQCVIFPVNCIRIGTIKIYGNLIDESLVSIGNALKVRESGTAKLTLSDTSKSRLNTIMGTVEDGLFTQDDEGTVTLYDFITQTKGWTVV